MLEVLESQLIAIKEATLLRRRALACLEKEIAAEPEDIRDKIRNYAESYLATINRNAIKQYAVGRPEFCTSFHVKYHRRGARAVLISETGDVLTALPLRSGRLARIAGKSNLKKLFMNFDIVPSRPPRSVRLEFQV